MGKIVTMIYVIPGISLNTAGFSACGNVMVNLIKLYIIWMETKILKHKRIVMFRRKVILLQILITMLVSAVYIAYEKSSVLSHLGMLDLLYFFVTTMTTIGFGDLTANRASFKGKVFIWKIALELLLFLLVFAMIASIITAVTDTFTQGKGAIDTKNTDSVEMKNEILKNEFVEKNKSIFGVGREKDGTKRNEQLIINAIM